MPLWLAAIPAISILKNGLPATLSDIRQYDVATYDKASKTLYICDLRLTGVYENVSPSPATPLSVTIMGATFPVLSSAYADLASFKIGDTVTLLLTSDGQVAGAVSPSVAKSTTVGVAKMEGTTATVTPLADIRDSDGEKGRVHRRHHLYRGERRPDAGPAGDSILQ